MPAHIAHFSPDAKLAYASYTSIPHDIIPQVVLGGLGARVSRNYRKYFCYAFITTAGKHMKRTNFASFLDGLQY
ncbi:hypothetical protein BDR04DRAFT_1092339 [Suillus decipiens]|nr:hypothetical protein BDR04DRAFT_1092339 [Suillus decipiens]